MLPNLLHLTTKKNHLLSSGRTRPLKGSVCFKVEKNYMVKLSDKVTIDNKIGDVMEQLQQTSNNSANSSKASSIKPKRKKKRRKGKGVTL